MAYLIVSTPQGPAALNLQAQGAVLATLLALRPEVTATVSLPASRTAERQTGLVWPDAPAVTPALDLQVTAEYCGGQLHVSGAHVIPGMLHLTVASGAEPLHVCLGCGSLTPDDEHLCWPCRTEYRHYVTTGGTCPNCQQIGLIRRQHESGAEGWEDCVRCGYTRNLPAAVDA